MLTLLTLVILRICQCSGPKNVSCVSSPDRLETVCTEGGLLTIPTDLMDPLIRLLKITATKEKKNNLTITAGLNKFPFLEELHITKSNISIIAKNSFYNSKHLKVLDLCYNSLTDVFSYHFLGLFCLVELRLDHNRIHRIEVDALQRLSNLRVLSLVSNRIKELTPRLFRGLGKLQALDLSGNPLEELNPEVFRDVQALTKFSCRSCSLKNINPIIYNFLSSLVYLNLADNSIKYISSDEFKDLKKLKSLFLDGNQLPVILDGTFGDHSTPNLQTLSLSRNRLVKITTKAFLNLTTLEELNIAYNKLDKVESTTLSYVTNSLISLDVSGNNLILSDLKHNLQMILRLQKLSISDMSLGKKNLDIQLFDNLVHLKSLNLSGNQLTKFPLKFLSQIQNLTELDLSRNSLQGFDDTALVRLESIPILYLQNNPWTCDLCLIGSMLSKMREILSFQNVTCAMPYSMRGTKLNSLDADSIELCSTKDYEDSVAGLTVVSVETKLGIITIGVVVLVFFVSAVLLILIVTQCRQRDRGERIDRRSGRVFKVSGNVDSGISTIQEVDLKLTNET